MIRCSIALLVLFCGAASATEPVGDFDRYGVPAPGLRADTIQAPRADPEHPNPGAEQIYPALSRQLGEQGTVVLMLNVTKDGKVEAARVQSSSGYERLDDAARTTAVERWHFLPGTINGKAAPMQMPIRITFKAPGAGK